ncbi:unnamed protein product [Plutella xylostella]|uniref:(diamondback moth) hypothetical protein n=1 Tax=Plutella xylostella TaxID=51655 RepID=A0A8S4G725_PLUXY|nr:unnamed protein product [Plutella xylostella]
MPVGYPPLFPPRPQFNYYEYAGPWHVTYDERPHNLNVNFNLPPKNKEPPAQPCWIKPTIFYDGFWTEQKVKKWVAEQVEKQFPEDAPAPPAAAAPAPRPPSTAPSAGCFTSAAPSCKMSCRL